MSNMTTVFEGRFKAQDITFKNPRMQSEVARELAEESGQTITQSGIQVPVSLTPEQVINFYQQKISETRGTNECRVYEHTVHLIKDLLETRKKLITLEMKQPNDNEDTSNDTIDIDS